MRDRERERDDAAQRVREEGIKVTSDAINRYMLWEEQGKVCVYSGRPISLRQLLSGEVHEDHILPYPRSLDNSLMNRVVCFRDQNADKGNRTPYEWLAASRPQQYEQILGRADRLPYPKARRFGQKSIELTDFFARQFVDTAYITTQVREYVECLGCDVVCTKGQHTAELRRHWGLNTVLRDDGLDLKNREDHRHHAVDAVVIALTNRSRLQQLAQIRRAGGTEETGEVLSDPWPNFREEVYRIVNEINVSHRVLRKLRGALHEETIYGPTAKPGQAPAKAERPWSKNWIEEEGVYVSRKPLEALTLAEVDRIRDDRVRELVQDRLAKFGVKAGRKKKTKRGEAEESGGAKTIPKEVWKEALLLTPRDGPGENPAVIRKVRVTKPEQSIRPIRQSTAFVKPGSLHHLCIFEFEENGKRKREAVFVSMLEAMERVRQCQPLIQRVHPTRLDAKFIMSLSRGEMVLGWFKGKERLVFFSTAASTQGQLYFVAHTDARPSADVVKFAVMANTLKGRKVAVDPLGRLRWAND
jgi:CRISPR-associated endonuclease Csn1